LAKLDRMIGHCDLDSSLGSDASWTSLLRRMPSRSALCPIRRKPRASNAVDRRASRAARVLGRRSFLLLLCYQNRRGWQIWLGTMRDTRLLKDHPSRDAAGLWRTSRDGDFISWRSSWAGSSWLQNRFERRRAPLCRPVEEARDLSRWWSTRPRPSIEWSGAG